MARVRTARFRVFIDSGRHGTDGDIPALLDMLRYEAGRVEAWDRAKDARDRDGFLVTITTEHPAPDRWRSFGITPQEV